MDAAETSIVERPFGTQFFPLAIEYVTHKAELMGLDLALNARVDNDTRIVSDFQSIQNSIARLDTLLETVQDYVSRVLVNFFF